VTCSCGVYGVAAERQFTEQIAARDLETYLRKGPGRTTRLLRDGLLQAGQVDGIVLDIGAGIGALTFELLEAGATRAIAVDASPAYIATASREAARRNRLDAIQFIRGDFLDAASQIPSAAVVTLDRVVCCYPASVPLLTAALQHAEQRFAFSYPRDRWYVRVWNAILNGTRRLTGNSFRTYIHSTSHMARIVSDAGFRRMSHSGTWGWSVDVYARSTPGSK
jgi:magnesium-protoporphyrin O-methyltransferase